MRCWYYCNWFLAFYSTVLHVHKKRFVSPIPLSNDSILSSEEQFKRCDLTASLSGSPSRVLLQCLKPPPQFPAVPQCPFLMLMATWNLPHSLPSEHRKSHCLCSPHLSLLRPLFSDLDLHVKCPIFTEVKQNACLSTEFEAPDNNNFEKVIFLIIKTPLPGLHNCNI